MPPLSANYIPFASFGDTLIYRNSKGCQNELSYTVHCSPSTEYFLRLLNTKDGSTSNKGSKKKPEFALTVRTIKQQ